MDYRELDDFSEEGNIQILHHPLKVPEVKKILNNLTKRSNKMAEQQITQ